MAGAISESGKSISREELRERVLNDRETVTIKAPGPEGAFGALFKVNKRAGYWRTYLKQQDQAKETARRTPGKNFRSKVLPR